MAIYNFSLSALFILFISACIIIEDVSAQWENAPNDMCISALAPQFYKASFESTPEKGTDISRSFTHKGIHFMLIKEHPKNVGAHLYRFKVENGVLISFRPDPTKRDAFEAAFPENPVIFKNDTAILPSLEADNLTFLANVAKKEHYWREDKKFLYNPLLREECIYDDRDLSTLK